MLTVGGVVYEPPFVTLTKTTRCADGVALLVNVTFGLAVMVTTALDVRSAVL